MIKAVIFDMDGVLIDSEPLWQRTEVEVFNKLGIALTPEMQIQTKGLRSDEMVNYWSERFDLNGSSKDKIVLDYEKRMTEIFMEEVQLMDGARPAIGFLRDLGLPLALASSSAMQFIDIFLDRFGFREYFSVAYSAENEPYGKPHPGVYLQVAGKLGCDPTTCLAIEDSFHGLIAAKAARMKVIVLPEPGERDDPRYGAADWRISGLQELNRYVIEQFNN
jgi:sugar-phosphatase